jgi:hypothetical protein
MLSASADVLIEVLKRQVLYANDDLVPSVVDRAKLNKNEVVRMKSIFAGVFQFKLLEPDARLVAVRELDAGGLEGLLQISHGAVIRFAFSRLKIGNRRAANLGRLR